MRAALAALPGVRHVDVDFEKKEAIVTATEALDSQKLVAALEGAGFGGAVKDVHRADAESNGNREPNDSTEKPPLPGLSAKEDEASSANTTYSSASFAEHVQIRAHFDHDVLRSGENFRIAVVFDIDDDWHIYGNPLGPGIGKATVVAAEESNGFEFGPARYAVADRAEQDFGEAGRTWVWQHTGKTVHFLTGKVSGDAAPGAYQLTVNASAQVCTEGACLPGKATIQLPVIVVAADAASRPANNELFKSFDQTRSP